MSPSGIERLAADALAAFRAGILPAGGNYIGLAAGSPFCACGLGAAYLHKHNGPPSCLPENWGGAIRRWVISEYALPEAAVREFSAGFDGYRDPIHDYVDVYWLGRAVRQAASSP